MHGGGFGFGFVPAVEWRKRGRAARKEVREGRMALSGPEILNPGDVTALRK